MGKWCPGSWPRDDRRRRRARARVVRLHGCPGGQRLCDATEEHRHLLGASFDQKGLRAYLVEMQKARSVKSPRAACRVILHSLPVRGRLPTLVGGFHDAQMKPPRVILSTLADGCPLPDAGGGSVNSNRQISPSGGFFCWDGKRWTTPARSFLFLRCRVVQLARANPGTPSEPPLFPTTGEQVRAALTPRVHDCGTMVARLLRPLRLVVSSVQK